MMNVRALKFLAIAAGVFLILAAVAAGTSCVMHFALLNDLLTGANVGQDGYLSVDLNGHLWHLPARTAGILAIALPLGCLLGGGGLFWYGCARHESGPAAG